MKRRIMKQQASSSSSSSRKININNLSSSTSSSSSLLSVFGCFPFYIIVRMMSTFCLLTMMMEGKGIMFVVRASSSSSSSSAATTYYSFSSSYYNTKRSTITTSTASFVMIKQRRRQQQRRRSIASGGGGGIGLVVNNQKPFPRTVRTLSQPSPLYMNWLQNFFGGGAYNLQIDYTTLDYPGNELGQLAIDLSSSSTKGGTKMMPLNSPSNPNLELMTVAGGCFWGMELAYQRIEGVNYTTVGYTAGQDKAPTYDQVCAGNTGHTEAVCLYYDPLIVSYNQLLDVFFDRVDPTTVNGQGRDYGRQYRTGVYYHSPEQESMARQRFQEEQSKYTNKPIATELQQSTIFWPAEKYHQQYLEKGGRFGNSQSSSKGCTDEIRCYG